MDLAARLERLEAQGAVADLINRYAQVVRRDCPELTADLYVEHGVFEVRRGFPDREEFTVQSRVVGREAIRAFLLSGKGKVHPVPMVRGLIVEVDGARARANCLMQARLSDGGYGFWGEYHDECVREDGRWLFASRCFTIFPEPAGP